MRFTPQFLEEIRARLPVSEVVGKRVRLKKAGKEYKGLSPFQQEKTPSFTVNDQKGFYHDFSSGKHGNIFDFVMETEGVSFPEAVERLASMAGLAVPAANPDAARHEQRRKTLHDVMELAAKFFQDTLASRNGAKARGYLADRGLSPATQLQFRLGYAPAERFALKEYLGSQNVPVGDMVEAGLLVAGDDIPVPYDRFRDRVVFPIADLRGRVIAFGGRALEKDAQPKYLNSPETPLFKKSAVLFNLASARKSVAQGAQLIAVEGYVDVIALVAAGFGGAVAPLGTALTEEHLGMMWRMAPEPILCFDGDKAGQKAAYRSLELALPLLEPGQSLRFAVLPQGEDPDDLIRAKGAGAMQSVLGAALPLSEMLWEHEKQAHDLSTPEQRAGFETHIQALIARIADPKVKAHYREGFDVRLNELFGREAKSKTERQPWKPKAPRRPWGQRPSAAQEHRESRAVTGEVSDALKKSLVARASVKAASLPARTVEALLVAVVNHPFLLDEELDALTGLTIEDASLDKVRRELLHAASSGQSLESQGLRDHLTDRGLGGVYQAMEQRPLLRSMPFTQPGAPAHVVREGWSHAVNRHRKGTDLEEERILAAAALKSDDTEESRLRLVELDKAQKAPQGSEAGPPDSSSI